MEEQQGGTNYVSVSICFKGSLLAFQFTQQVQLYQYAICNCDTYRVPLRIEKLEYHKILVQQQYSTNKTSDYQIIGAQKYIYVEVL